MKKKVVLFALISIILALYYPNAVYADDRKSVSDITESDFYIDVNSETGTVNIIYDETEEFKYSSDSITRSAHIVGYAVSIGNSYSYGSVKEGHEIKYTASSSIGGAKYKNYYVKPVLMDEYGREVQCDVYARYTLYTVPQLEHDKYSSITYLIKGDGYEKKNWKICFDGEVIEYKVEEILTKNRVIDGWYSEGFEIPNSTEETYTINKPGSYNHTVTFKTKSLIDIEATTNAINSSGYNFITADYTFDVGAIISDYIVDIYGNPIPDTKIRYSNIYDEDRRYYNSKIKFESQPSNTAYTATVEANFEGDITVPFDIRVMPKTASMSFTVYPEDSYFEIQIPTKVSTRYKDPDAIIESYSYDLILRDESGNELTRICLPKEGYSFTSSSSRYTLTLTSEDEVVHRLLDDAKEKGLLVDDEVVCIDVLPYGKKRNGDGYPDSSFKSYVMLKKRIHRVNVEGDHVKKNSYYIFNHMSLEIEAEPDEEGYVFLRWADTLTSDNPRILRQVREAATYTPIMKKSVGYPWLEVTPSACVLRPGETIQLSIDTTNASSDEIYWLSYNTSLATVDDEGVVTVSSNITEVSEVIVSGATIDGSGDYGICTITIMPENCYSIGYHLDGGINSSNNPTAYKIGEEVLLENATKQGYDFVEWRKNSIAGPKITKVEASLRDNIDVYAIFTPKNIDITFDTVYYTTTPPNKSVTYDSEYGDLPIPTLFCHHFDGWYTHPVRGYKIEPSTIVKYTNDIILYAHWKDDCHVFDGWDYTDNEHYKVCECGEIADVENHSYGEHWVCDDIEHYYECICGSRISNANHTYGDENVIRPATHLQSGIGEKECSVCHYKLETVIPKISVHSYGEWKSDSTGHYKECACGERTDTDGHSYGDETVKTAATHLDTGIGEKECSVCHYKIETIIPRTTEHTYGEWKSDSTGHYKECACGVKSDSEGHVYGDETVKTAATHLETGTGEKECSTCHYKIETIIPKTTEHTYGEWESDSTGHYKECACGARADFSGHVYGDETVIQEPTDVQDGVGEKKCSICQYKIETIIPMLTEHTYGSEWKSDSTGHYRECACGAKSEVSGHTYGDEIVKTAATHLSTGTGEKECTICHYKVETTIPKLAEHTYGDDWKSDNTGHFKECVCGAKADITGHTYGDEIVKTEATHLSTGTGEKECTICHYKIETIIPKLAEHTYGDDWKSNSTGHYKECACGDKTSVTAHTFGEEIVKAVATHLKDGKGEKECSVCHYKIETTIPKLTEHTYGEDWKTDSTGHYKECLCGDKTAVTAHTYGGEIVKVAATHLKDGKGEKECSVCHYKIETTIPKLTEHTYGEDWKTDATGHYKECACGDKTAVTAHTYGDETVKVAATHLKDGKGEKECSVCRYKIETTISKLTEHTYGVDWKADSTGHYKECACGAKATVTEHVFSADWKEEKAPSYSEDGKKYVSCSTCGYKKYETIPKKKSEDIIVENGSVNGSSYNVISEISNEVRDKIYSQLSNDEKTLVSNGTKIKIYGDIEQTSDVSDAQKDKIKSALPTGYGIDSYYNISMKMKVGDAQGKTIEPYGKVTVHLPVSSDIANKIISERYSVILLHLLDDNSVENLSYSYNSSSNEMIFETYSFSKFAVATKDEKSSGSGSDSGSSNNSGSSTSNTSTSQTTQATPVVNNGNGTAKASINNGSSAGNKKSSVGYDEVPKTGETNELWFLPLIALMSVLGIAYSMRMWMKKTNTNR